MRPLGGEKREILNVTTGKEANPLRIYATFKISQKQIV